MLIAFCPARDATMKTYKQLTYEERCQIYALNKSQMSQNKIAKQLNVSQSTISREFSRKTGFRGYRIKLAQRLAQQRRVDATKAIKMSAKLIELINLKLYEKWSPEKISGWLEVNETIYQHIWRDKHRGGDLLKESRRKGININLVANKNKLAKVL